ncbi:hypothetical protein SSP35_20_00300 [Streptomyces sp. NBRC 110611]|nr:hypothetical protein SSP35_20_00300 [Streptomyces sp. NBRC 110611]
MSAEVEAAVQDLIEAHMETTSGVTFLASDYVGVVGRDGHTDKAVAKGAGILRSTAGLGQGADRSRRRAARRSNRRRGQTQCHTQECTLSDSGRRRHVAFR